MHTERDTVLPILSVRLSNTGTVVKTNGHIAGMSHIVTLFHILGGALF